ncbi:hypothetical protein G5714_019413 [Onychostoma macrolepis]|uniref:Uncharacterized protein n=1 Tax=Onychostoma macrolepis TaxID=369639 RepID=A0A7J6BWB5_9TELE|nr:hypothetical protein G5714_019413 [Onychostoma macrolepis]
MNNLKFNVLCVCVCVCVSFSLSLSLSFSVPILLILKKLPRRLNKFFKDSTLHSPSSQIFWSLWSFLTHYLNKGRPIMGFEFGHLVCLRRGPKAAKTNTSNGFFTDYSISVPQYQPFQKLLHLSLSRVADLLPVLYCKLPVLACLLVLISPVQLTLPSLL